MRLPSAPGVILAWLSLAMSFSVPEVLSAQEWTPSFHRDHRQTVKYQIFPAVPVSLAATDPQATAWSYLRAQAADFGLTPDLYGVRLLKQQESLLGWHLRFAQEQAGVPIEGAEIIISILKADNRIYEVYNTLQPRPGTTLRNKSQLTLDNAYDRAWNYLGVQGKLFEAPAGSLRYLVEGDSLRAAYKIELSTTAPYGAFLIYVDAESGKILRAEDQRVSHKPWAPRPEFRSKGPLSHRLAAFTDFQKNQEKFRDQAPTTLANGKARLFDPDPRTTLLNNNLQDNDAASVFDAAYFQRELKDISFNGSQYKLEGPWVKILDWDPPTNAPSSSTDGQWLTGRGNNAFNDAMTYYHLDQSQRYMQALGFVGTRGIQAAPIEVDTDGVNGDDNSYFQPSSNRLSFGHGCVDDNEDTDVILHEYGHAIHFSINPNWGGGDTGAMGEGFGDYWAASYSLSTPNGPNFFPNQIYSWDGHGQGDPCWPGRVLNATAAQFDPSRSYGAHTTIENGVQSDELWSTPLFQALLSLRALNVPREEVDTIILQAQFGLGSGITMREMAQAILLTAEQLYPNGPHVRVFKENFLRHNIIEEPHAIISATLAQVSDAGGNGVIEPGEEVELKFTVKNSGTLVATQVVGSLTSDAQGTVLVGSADYPDLEIGQSASNATAFKLKANSNAICGTVIKIVLTVRYEDHTVTFPAELRIGKPIGVRLDSTPNIAIPDADSKGVTDIISANSQGKVSDQLKISVEIKHPYRGDLKLVLTSPSGKTVLLHDRQGISDDDIIGTYPVTLIPKEALTKLVGDSLSGKWQLNVADLASADIGTFVKWGLEDITAWQCQ